MVEIMSENVIQEVQRNAPWIGSFYGATVAVSIILNIVPVAVLFEPQFVIQSTGGVVAYFMNKLWRDR